MQVLPADAPAFEHDYTGVVLQQLRAAALPVMERKGLKAHSISERVEMDTREIARILESALDSTVIGIHKADKILMAIGLNIGSLVLDGSISIVPLDAHFKNARRMAFDEFWVNEIEPTEDMLHTRAVELRELKAEIVGAARRAVVAIAA